MTPGAWTGQPTQPFKHDQAQASTEQPPPGLSQLNSVNTIRIGQPADAIDDRLASANAHDPLNRNPRTPIEASSIALSDEKSSDRSIAEYEDMPFVFNGFDEKAGNGDRSLSGQKTQGEKSSGIMDARRRHQGSDFRLNLTNN